MVKMLLFMLGTPGPLAGSKNADRQVHGSHGISVSPGDLRCLRIGSAWCILECSFHWRSRYRGWCHIPHGSFYPPKQPSDCASLELEQSYVLCCHLLCLKKSSRFFDLIIDDEVIPAEAAAVRTNDQVRKPLERSRLLPLAANNRDPDWAPSTEIRQSPSHDQDRPR